jgi:glutamine amidotransferase
MLVAVIDYNSGNLASAARGLVLAAEQRGISVDVRITADPDVVARADRIVLPGQGAFADCAAGLARWTGWSRPCSHGWMRGRPF